VNADLTGFELLWFQCAGQRRQRIRTADTTVTVLSKQDQGTDIAFVVKQQAVILEYVGLPH
jgi:hypothetical protein